jgi:MFS transporter, AAHS family, 4-hydroxybenzoate transporter
LLLATAVRRFGAFRLLAVGNVGGCVALVLLSTMSTSMLLLQLLAFVAGFFVIGTQTVANALSALVYPTSMRTTGIGGALGVGRIGSVVGPMAGGTLIGLHWSTNHLFLVAAIPAAIAAVAALKLAGQIRESV